MLELKQTTNYQNIYNDMAAQFPPSELKPYNVFCELFKSSKYILFELFDNNISTGYTIIFEGENFILADYIAIKKNVHSKGYGSKIIKLLPEYFPEKKGCFFEVEKINPDDINTRRRAAFYTSNGAERLNLNYIYPNSLGGLPMDLYLLNFSDNMPEYKEILNFIKELFEFLHKDIKNIREIYSQIK